MFVVYRESDKSPVDVQTLLPTNAQDRANWMTPEHAYGWAQHLGPGYGVGIVLHKGCGIACVDIDGALQADNSWSPLAVGLCQRFAGAAIEVSLSGRGLHIFFSYRGEPPEHKSKNTQLHIEFYTDARYIALTGTNLAGDVFTDHTDTLPNFIAQYFPTTAPLIANGEWSIGPVADWNGPADDDALLEKMLANVSPRQMFGGKLRVAELFHANEAKLASAFPPNKPDDPYDRSSADMALANHLAFWTGRDCERMERLMRRSALARDKWEQRPDWLRDTILNAARSTTSVYSANRAMPWRAEVAGAPESAGQGGAVARSVAEAIKAQEQPLAPTGKPWDSMTPEEQAEALPARDNPPPGTTIGTAEMIAMWRGFMYVEDVHMILGPDGIARDQKRFDARYGGLLFVKDIESAKPCASAWDAFIDNQAYRFARVRGMRFDPLHEPGAIIDVGGQLFANSYKPKQVAMIEGDALPFVDHVFKLLPNGDDALIYLSSCAGQIQHRGHKPRWCPLLQGAPGNGKSTVSKVMAFCVGDGYWSSPKAKELASRFNGWAEGVLLVIVEDVYSHGNAGDILEVLKPMITEEALEIERKGVDKVMRHCPFGMLLNSNHRDAIRKTDDDRRFAIFYTAQQCKADLARDGLTTEYFQQLNHWLEAENGFAIAHHYLAHFAIPERYDFTKGALIAPLTTSLPDSLLESEGFVEQELRERIEEGKPGFAGGWISGDALKAMLSELGGRRTMSRTKRVAMLKSMGYILHPALKEGRPTHALPDGTRPQLFVRYDLPAASLLNAPEIRAAYMAANTPT